MAEETPCGRRGYGHPGKRAAILAAARRMFLTKGHLFSIDDVAEAAQVSKQTIYNQFGSKEALLHTLTEDKVVRLTAPFSHAHDNDPPRKVLTAFAEVAYDLILTPDSLEYLRSLVGLSRESAGMARDFYDTGPKATLRELSVWLARQHQKGTLNVPDPDLAAEHFSSLLFGHVQLKGLLGLPCAVSAEEKARRVAFCVAIFLAGCASGTKPNDSGAEVL